MESLEVINKRLIEYFGKAWNNSPNWRIVWSEDQFEKRATNYSDSGMQLLHYEIRELPKYRQWIQNKFVLERLTVVPEMNQDELVDKFSYEPIYVFEDKHGNPLPVTWNATQFAVKCVMDLQGTVKVYSDPYKNNPIEKRIEEIKELEEDLFGDDTKVSDALTYGEGIVVPTNYKRNES